MPCDREATVKIIFIRGACLLLATVFVGGRPAIAQGSEQTICNSKSPTTNIRDGAGVKKFQLIEALPNGAKVTILSTSKNEEGFVWHNISYVSPSSKETKTGWVYSEAVAETCASDDAKAATPSSQQMASPAEPAKKYIDLSADPVGYKGCSGYKVPLSLITSPRGMLSSPRRIEDIESTECTVTKFDPMFSMGGTFHDIIINIKTSRTKEFYGRVYKCTDSVIFRGEAHADGEFFVSGAAKVFSQSRTNEIIKCSEPYFVKKEEEHSRKSLVALVYFLGDRVYYNEEEYKRAAEEERVVEQLRREEERVAARSAFQNLIDEQPDGQALYLLGGKFEREGEQQKATSVYERILSKYASSEWAVKANDRLLAMSGDSKRASDAQQLYYQQKSDAHATCRKRFAECIAGCQVYGDGDKKTSCQHGCPSCD
jgi:hypothetical protein